MQVRHCEEYICRETLRFVRGDGKCRKGCLTCGVQYLLGECTTGKAGGSRKESRGLKSEELGEMRLLTYHSFTQQPTMISQRKITDFYGVRPYTSVSTQRAEATPGCLENTPPKATVEQAKSSWGPRGRFGRVTGHRKTCKPLQIMH